MIRFTFDVPEEIAQGLRRKAEAKHVSVATYLADMVRREVGSSWPAGYFTALPGAWEGDLERPPQLEYEHREPL